MGGKKSSSKQTSTVSTNTTTNIRDIGLTGAAAVDLANVIETGGIKHAQITGDVLDTLIQTVGGSFQTLVGGASNLVETASGQTKDMLAKIESLQKEGQSTELTKIMPWLLAAVVGVAAIPLFTK